MAVSAAATDTTSAALYAALNGTKASETKSATESTQARFLTLLTAQLKNQDPLSPMDNAEMTSQLAQISTVDGIERLNSTLQALLDDSQSVQNLQAAALVGHGVLVPGEKIELASGKGVAGLELASAADEVTVKIHDGSGNLVRTLALGARDAGVLGFAWDGKDDSGVAAVDGKYSFTVTAKVDGDAVDVSRLAYGVVDGVVRTGTTTQVSVGSFGRFATGDIRTIM